MKKFLFAIVSLVSLSAQADLGDYWNSRYIIQDKLTNAEGIPNTGVSTGYQTHYIKITATCQEGNEVRSVKPLKTCKKWGPKPLSRSQCDNRGDNFPCFDRDENVCVETVEAIGRSPIKYKQKTCAALMDRESSDWRRRNADWDRFENDYPNCSVFKTFDTKKRTDFVFNIIKKVGDNHPRYENRYGGQFLFELDYSIPQCEGALE